MPAVAISIHAPAKGATPSRAGVFLSVEFQSTLPRRERREPRYGCAWADGISIHAPAKGATPQGIRSISPPIFQSTLPRRERPNYLCSNLSEVQISIHAPAKGATCIRQSAVRVTAISIHAPAKGATGVCTVIAPAASYFNPRSREGSDQNLQNSRSIGKISIHAPAKGATANPFKRTVYLTSFQSTLPRRERQYRASMS